MAELLWHRYHRAYVAGALGSFDTESVSTADMDAAARLARARQDMYAGRQTASGYVIRPWVELDEHDQGRAITEAVRWVRAARLAGLIE